MKKIYTLLVIIFFSLSAIAQTTYYVRTDGSDLNDGKSWTNAFATLTKAVESSVKNDEIKMGSGVYNSASTCLIDKSLTITGSFDDNGNQKLSELTVLDGINTHKIMKIVEPITGIPVHVTLDGLCFANGSFNGTANGAAIEFLKSSGMVNNCVFRSNNAISSGGGALSFDKTTVKSTIVNCLFKDNSAKFGGAVYSGQRTVVDIINSTISKNSCEETGSGGGVYADGTVSLQNSILWENKKGNEDDQINGKGKYYLDHNILQGGVLVDNIDNHLQSNMVIQQNSSFTISGRNVPGQQIKVACSWNTNETYNLTANTNGYWSVQVQTPVGSFEPVTISVEGKEKKEFTNILIGEVWFCSGQSNMKLRVKDAENGPAEVADAQNYPNIRLLNIDIAQSEIPLDALKEKWQVCSSATIPNFSAVGYFFGRKLFQDLNVPIGLINASWGDTTAEVWVNRDSVLNSTDPAVIVGATRNDQTPRSTLSTAYKIGSAYNAMIYPLRNIPVKGAIWYQGESNQGYPYYYPGLLKILVKNWRSLWGADEQQFPFYIAQICPYNRMHNFPTYYSNPAMRFMLAKATEIIPNSGIECNDDLANLTDIHPKNKQDVGLRLAWMALFKTYGKTLYENKMTALYTGHVIDGNQFKVSFSNAGTGLTTKDAQAPSMFEICGSDKVFYPANAVIEDNNSVVLTNSSVQNPVAARLGWSYVNTTNLTNSEGIPVSVFKTYDWADVSEELK